MKRVIKWGKLAIELDRNQVIPNDPGAGCPALVTWGEYTASYTCAQNEEELTNSLGETHRLTPKQVQWLFSKEDVVNRFLYPGND